MFYTLNKFYDKFCDMKGNINDIYLGLNLLTLSLSDGFADNKEQEKANKIKIECYKCLCKMLLYSNMQYNDVKVLISNFFPLIAHLHMCPNLLNEDILDKLLSHIDTVLYSANTNEAYINKYNNFLCNILSVNTLLYFDNDNKEQYTTLINYFYMNYIEHLRLVDKDKTVNDKDKEYYMKYYFKLYQLLLILYKERLCRELNETSLNGFIDLYEEIRIRIEYVDKDNEVLNIFRKVLKVIVLIFLECGTGEKKLQQVEKKVYKLKELPCTLFTIETILSSMINASSSNEVIEFNRTTVNCVLNVNDSSMLISRFNIIMSILCRNRDNNSNSSCSIEEYKMIYELIMKCFYDIAKLDNDKCNSCLYNEFFTYKHYVCISFFALFLFYGSKPNNAVIETEQTTVNDNVVSWHNDEEFKTKIKKDFLYLTELLISTHSEPFPLHLLNIIISRNHSEIDSQLTFNILIDVLRIITTNTNNINAFINNNVIEIIKLVHLFYYRYKPNSVTLYNNNTFITLYSQICTTLLDMCLMHIKVLYNYIDVSKKATPNEFIFDFLLKLYQDTKQPTYLNTLSHIFLIPKTHDINNNTTITFNNDNTNTTSINASHLLKHYNTLLYDIDLFEFKYQDKYKTITNNLRTALSPFEELNEFLITQFYLMKVLLHLYIHTKQETTVDTVLIRFYNVFGEMLFNDYGMLLNESKLMKRNKKRKSENGLYEQVGVVYNKIKAKGRTFDVFKKMCFDMFDKTAGVEGYARLSSYSLIKKVGYVNNNNSNNDVNVNINMFRTNTSNSNVSNGSVNSGGNNSNDNNNKITRNSYKRKSLSTSSPHEDLYLKQQLSSHEYDLLFLYDEESGNQSSLGLEYDSIEVNNQARPSMNTTNKSKQNQSNSQSNRVSNVNNTEQTKTNFFTNIFTFNKNSEQPQNSINIPTTSIKAHLHIQTSNLDINDFKELTINNCILSPKKELLMSYFSNVYKDVFFYNEEFIRLKRYYINKLLPEDTNTKQLNYPSKLRNYSNTYEPNYFLKQDKHFYEGNPYFNVSYSYYKNKWNINNEKKINIIKPHYTTYHLDIPENNIFHCELITNSKNIFGHIILTTHYLLFEHLSVDPRKDSKDINIQLEYIFSSLDGDIIVRDKQVLIFYQNITELLIRRFLYMWQSLEMYVKDGRSYYFNLFSEDKLKQLITLLTSILKAHKHAYTSVLSLDAISKIIKDNQIKWKNGTITVYDYLLLINKYSSRTYKDVNQYPVFPWVTTNLLCIKNIFNLVDDNLKDTIIKPNDFILELHEKYSIVDFDDKKTHSKDVKISKRLRLFTYPICAQTEDKRQQVMLKYNDFIRDNAFPHHYGNHYSTGSFIYFYLMRMSPFNNELIYLQNGFLENPNRMFYSFKDTVNILKQGNDTREPIPEVYSLIEYMINLNCVYYRTRTDTSLVDDFVLGKDINTLDMYVMFLFQQRKLLNSDIVASEIHNWFNYVFGVNQLSDNEESCTMFPKQTYAQKMRLNEKKQKYMNTLTPVQTKLKLKEKVNVCINFGQTPHKVFNELHPKYKNNLVNVNKDNQDELLFLLSQDIKQQEYIDEQHYKDQHCHMQFRYVNVSCDKKMIYYVYSDVVFVKTFNPDEQVKSINHITINNFIKNSSCRTDINVVYKFNTTQNVYRNYKSSLLSPKYCYVLMNKNNFFISCRYLDNTFKLYKAAKKITHEHIWAMYTGSFVNAICKVNDNAFITGHYNGMLSEWKLKVENTSTTTTNNKSKGDSSNADIKPKCVHIRSIIAHECAINVIEYYARLNVVITASDDNCIYIRKYYDFELLGYIRIPIEYKVIEINISTLNMVYVLCYHIEHNCHVVMGFTLNGIKFAQSDEGVYTNIQFTRNGNVIVGNIDKGYIEILTAFALNVLATAKIRTFLYKENVGNEDRLVDMVWIRYLIDETLLIVGVAKGYVLYYRMLEDEPENKMFS